MSNVSLESRSQQEREESFRHAGIHLSGPNANKTSLVVLSGDPLQSPLKILKVYEKIGSFGTLFSDERLVDILTHSGSFSEVFIDCPLTMPPCVSCTRPLCPGAIQCDDVSVAYMLAISSKLRRRGARKSRPINPQSQRLWDVMNFARDGSVFEPSYSANQAPLVARAMTLQRRLNALSPSIQLKETAVGHSLVLMSTSLRLSENECREYRNFEDGLSRRRLILSRMVDRGWIAAEWEKELYETVIRSAETFQSFITAWVAALHSTGLTHDQPEGYVDGEGWVYLPDINGKVEQPVPVFG